MSAGDEALHVELHESAEAGDADGPPRFQAPWTTYLPSARSREARAAFATLGGQPVRLSECEARIHDEHGVEELARFHLDLAALLHGRLVRIGVRSASTPDGPRVAALESTGFGFRPVLPPLPDGCRFRLSRFSSVRRDPEAGLVLESPLAHARLHLGAPAGAVVHALADGVPAAALRAGGGLSEDEVAALLRLVVAAGVGGVVDASGALAEDRDAMLRQWEFHDLLFHARSRAGRHGGPIGGRFRFLGELPPQPAVKVTGWPMAALLPRPDLLSAMVDDPPLAHVMERRRSTRLLAGPPVTLDDLGEFLYRVARVRSRFAAGDIGEFTSRPYPSGGASYELELYANVGDHGPVAPALYWYDPVEHGLRLVRPADHETRALAHDAHIATAEQAWPQILFVVAARFQRVSWKYDAMAYATILKNTGVLYATMYLVATAMGLAACALGTGDSDRFARIARTRYVEETSVGEFMLCGGRGSAA